MTYAQTEKSYQDAVDTREETLSRRIRRCPWKMVHVSRKHPGSCRETGIKKSPASSRQSERLPLLRTRCWIFQQGWSWDRDQVEHGWKRTDATFAIYQGFLENHFLKVFGACNIQELEPSEINITIKSLNRINGSPYARGTRNKMLYALSLMFTYWRQQGLVKENPLDGVVKYIQ